MSTALVNADNVNRGMSPLVWRHIPTDEVDRDPNRGFGLFDDFLQFLSDGDRWNFTQATAGTGVVGDGVGGILVLDAGSSTADQGSQIQLWGESFLPSTNAYIALEARLHLTFPTLAQFFLGLSVEDTSLFATGENSSADHIGFEMGATVQAGASAGKAQFYSEKGGTRTTVADVHTFVSADYVKLGFLIHPLTHATSGAGKVEIFVNGVKFATEVSANIPITEMTPTIACLSEGTSQPVCTVDWIKCYQFEAITN